MNEQGEKTYIDVIRDVLEASGIDIGDWPGPKEYLVLRNLARAVHDYPGFVAYLLDLGDQLNKAGNG